MNKGRATIVLLAVVTSWQAGALMAVWPTGLARFSARCSYSVRHSEPSRFVGALSLRCTSKNTEGEGDGTDPLSMDGDRSAIRGPKGKTCLGNGRVPEDSVVVSVSDEDNNAPIDWVLSRRLPVNSRRYYRKLIQEGGVKVNGKTMKRFARVKSGSNIQLARSSPGKMSGPKPLLLKPENLDLVVEYEDEHLVAVRKPGGMVVQPCEGARKGTVLHGLLHHLIATKQVKKDDPVAAQRLLQGIVHRLDKDTSGIMVVAKTLEASSKLSGLFKNQEVHKGYLAVCHGDPGRETLVKAPVYRRSSGKMAAVWPEEAEIFGAKDAETWIRNVATSRGTSLCEAEITTGRMHQVRVHLKFKGYPIVGDRVYGDPELNARVARRSVSRIDVKRPLLHAATLEFRHPYTKNFLSLKAPMPEDMWDVASRILRASGTPAQIRKFKDLQGVDAKDHRPRHQEKARPSDKGRNPHLAPWVVGWDSGAPIDDSRQ
ncbi:unnamed protein product [Choristocarpus tenellus]